MKSHSKDGSSVEVCRMRERERLCESNHRDIMCTIETQIVCINETENVGMKERDGENEFSILGRCCYSL